VTPVPATPRSSDLDPSAAGGGRLPGLVDAQLRRRLGDLDPAAERWLEDAVVDLFGSGALGREAALDLARGLYWTSTGRDVDAPVEDVLAVLSEQPLTDDALHTAAYDIDVALRLTVPVDGPRPASLRGRHRVAETVALGRRIRLALAELHHLSGPDVGH
jgi:hypothetical protein